jgi:hypothetical protein
MEIIGMAFVQFLATVFWVAISS